MTGEPVHIASIERIAPEVIWFLSERVPQLSINEVAITLLCSAHYTGLQMKESRRSTSAINPVTMKNMDDLHAPTIKLLLIHK